ncbi:hypothetical protein ACFVUS_31050 [Nocardia sp. NPDC058058]|uniref:hypothetical protein n=1 Tax=Nocardia sp. NPDC058058 TaxID=3346317 RepID=UPI0036DAB46E
MTFALDFENFVLGTERVRELGSVADPTIDALYQVIGGIRKLARDTDRSLTAEEALFIGNLSSRTFMLWEEMQEDRPKAFWYRAPAQPPARRRWFRRR